MDQNQQLNYEEQFQLNIKLDRATQTYNPTEWISGSIQVQNIENENFPKFSCHSIEVSGEGILNAQNKLSNTQLQEITSNLNPVILFNQKVTIAEDEDVKASSSFNFKMKLIPEPGQKLSETYVGVYISISYEINCTFKFKDGKKIHAQIPFYVQCPGQGKENIRGQFQTPRPAIIEMTPQKLLQQNQKVQVPNFKIKGMLESDICYFNEDIKGSFIIENCDGKIRTIDLQLIRVERIENNMQKFQEATEIQLIQVADGNVSRKIEIPIFMIFPIYFSCPNFTNGQYQVDFEVNFIMILFDGFKITMNFPLNIVRS